MKRDPFGKDESLDMLKNMFYIIKDKIKSNLQKKVHTLNLSQ